MKDLQSKKTGNALLIFSMVLIQLFLGCKKDQNSETAIRDDFIGTWQCEEFDVSNQLLSSFQVEIIADPFNRQIIHLDNFNLMGNGLQLEAEIDKGLVIIPQQSLAGNSYSGNGAINDNHTGIEMQYVVQDPSGIVENIRAFFVKL
jgi:hypothetical protein